MVEYLVRLLQKKYKVATLSRGYGRKTKGFILANEHSNAIQIGDEPFQYYHKFGNKIHVVVGEERSVAIPKLLSQKPETQVVILDDAYQHRWVKPHLNILLTDYNHLFFKDYLLPFGRLRESRKGAKRADIIIITKCPDNISYKKEYIKMKLSSYITKEKVPVFFTNIKYGIPKPVFNNKFLFDQEWSIILFSGLANADMLRDFVKENYKLLHEIEFGDHHEYQKKDLENIIQTFKSIESSQKCLLTTEKDMVKLLTEESRAYLEEFPIFYLPIEVSFLENELSFQKIILKVLPNVSKIHKS
jgi:tetraacyldisaccharide 4'-kinase